MTFKEEMDELINSDFNELEELDNTKFKNEWKLPTINDIDELNKVLNNEPKEFIICSAINANGIIIAGKRHIDCYNTLRQLNNIEQNGREDQGFLTSHNRFVNHKEAWNIALINNQIKYGLTVSSQKTPDDNILISEKSLLIIATQYKGSLINFQVGDKIIMFDADEFEKLPKEQRNPIRHRNIWDTYYKECTVTKIYKNDNDWKCDVVFGARISINHYCSCAKSL